METATGIVLMKGGAQVLLTSPTEAHLEATRGQVGMQADPTRCATSC